MRKYLLRKLQASLMRQPPNFSWFSENIAASGLPNGRKHISWLKDRGITTILCLLEQPLNKEEATSMGLRYVNIPMEDHGKPEVEKLLEAVDVIKETISRDGKILIHCAAGLGRTGTVLAAYLIKEEGFDVDSAVEYVRRRRPGSIERKQVDALREFYKVIRAVP